MENEDELDLIGDEEVDTQFEEIIKLFSQRLENQSQYKGRRLVPNYDEEWISRYKRIL